MKTNFALGIGKPDIMRKTFIHLTVFVALLFWGHPCFPETGALVLNDTGGPIQFVSPNGEKTVYPYTVVVETHPGENRVNREVSDLRAKGMPAAVTYGHPTNMALWATGDSEAYTVHVGSFRKKEYSDTETARLRKKGQIAFSSAYDLPGKGVWHRVFLGLCRTREEAVLTADNLSREFPGARPHRVEDEFFEVCVGFQSTREEAVNAAYKLKKRGFPFAEVCKKPYAIQIAASDSEAELVETEYQAEQKGCLPYRVPDRQNRFVTRILIGAFEVEKDAAGMRGKLEKLGFKPVIVLR